MGIKKFVLNIILSFTNLFVRHKKIKSHQVAFVSLESRHLESDMKLIYDRLVKNHDITIKSVLIGYDKKNLVNDFLYMLNCIKQLIVINTSSVVIIRDNNYVISNFKRKGVKVIQVWHACGAIKKFGNVIHREYPIQNYDYIISNSDYWKEPYSQAFNVLSDHVITTGMPRVDHLFDAHYLTSAKAKMVAKFPQIANKKILLYAPTFRGNIYKGFTTVFFDAEKLLQRLGDEYVLLYKFHPLSKGAQLAKNKRIINANHEDTHDLFAVSDVLISDFSSIIFDYSLLSKPMYFYTPDLENYLNDLGCFVDYNQMPGAICYDIEQLAQAIHEKEMYPIEDFAKKFFKYHDGHNTDRVVQFIENLLKKEA